MLISKIEGYKDYGVSSNGIIIGKRGKRMKPDKASNGYHRIILVKNKRRYRKMVHRLVLENFVGPCPEGMETNHKNGIKTDNRLENLEWVTRSENIKHAMANGLNNSIKKLRMAGIETQFKPKLKPGEVWLVKKLIFHKKEHGLPFRIIGQMFKISRTAVYHINRKKSWGDIEYHLNKIGPKRKRGA